MSKIIDIVGLSVIEPSAVIYIASDPGDEVSHIWA